MYGVAHKSGFTMVNFNILNVSEKVCALQVTVSEDGTKQIQGQVICRPVGHNSALVSESDVRFIPYIVQVSNFQSIKKKVSNAQLVLGSIG